MSFIRRRGLVAAMEELQDMHENVDAEVEVTSNLGDQEVVRFNDLENSPEANEAALVEDAVEIATIGDAIEEGIEVSDQLEKHAETLEKAQEEGGLDETAAVILNDSLESLYKRIGMTFDGRVLPSVENFGGISKRMRATEISLEEVDGAIKKTFKAIGAGIVRIWEAIKKWVREWFTQVGRYERRLRTLKEKAAQVAKDGDKNTNPKPIEKSSLVRSFSLGHTVPNAAAITKELSDQSMGVNLVASNYPALAGTVMDKINDIVSSKDPAKILQTTEAIKTQFENIVTSMGQLKEGDDGVRESGLMLGNKYIEVSVKDSKGISVFGRNITSGKITASAKVASRTNEKVEGKLEVLNAGETSKMLTACEEILSALTKFNKEAQPKFDSVMNKFSSFMKKGAGSDLEAENRKAVESAIGMLAAVIKFPQAYVSYMTGLLSASLQYVEMSLKERNTKSE